MKRLKRQHSNLGGEIENYEVVTAMNEIGDMDQSEDFSQIFGLGKDEKKRKNLRAKSKADARIMKAKAKLGDSTARQTAAKGLAMDTTKADVAMAKALGKSAPKSEKGMSLGAKIGIGVGIAVVLGVGGYLLYKKMKK